MSTDLDCSSPTRLLGLLALGDGAYAVPEWRGDELGAVLGHQLASRIDSEMEHRPEMGNSPGTERATEVLTFAEVLTQPRPSAATLEWIKRFAKRSHETANGALPGQVATALYYTAIAAAYARCGRRITSLSDESIQCGIRWTLARDWLDVTIRALLEEATR